MQPLNQLNVAPIDFPHLTDTPAVFELDNIQAVVAPGRWLFDNSVASQCCDSAALILEFCQIRNQLIADYSVQWDQQVA